MIDKANRAVCIEAAEANGHKLGDFKRYGRVVLASCKMCGGCCWTTKLSIGGRLLKYRCGTPEAIGFLRTETRDAAMGYPEVGK